MTVPAGWYPDPGNAAQFRWWDGATWTAHVQGPQAPPPLPSSAGVSLRSDIARLERELQALEAQVVQTREVLALQEVGIYRYAHPLETAVAFKERLDAVDEQIRLAVRQGTAVVGTKQWSINGSQKEGAKMVADFCKLMLRAYNNEADNAVRTLKPFMLDAAIARLEKARETIHKLGRAMHIEVSPEYHALRVDELKLTADFLSKREEEREREREARAKMKEEEAVRRELEREHERLEKERAHYESVVTALRAKGDEAGVAKAKAMMEKIDGAIAGVENRAANTRAGYVYCISNIGAFGERVVKIGLTRRLDPMDRVRELGDASVPFRFDRHAMIFSEDAVGLETMLHHRFAEKRVNMVNAHREFFYVTPSEVREALAQLRNSNSVLEFEETPEALEWRQSENLRSRPSPDLT